MRNRLIVSLIALALAVPVSADQCWDDGATVDIELVSVEISRPHPVTHESLMTVVWSESHLPGGSHPASAIEAVPSNGGPPITVAWIVELDEDETGDETCAEGTGTGDCSGACVGSCGNPVDTNEWCDCKVSKSGNYHRCYCASLENTQVVIPGAITGTSYTVVIDPLDTVREVNECDQNNVKLVNVP